MKMAYTMLVLCFLLVAFLVANFVHNQNRIPAPYLLATIGNKSGVVVSHIPLDLRVTINTLNPDTNEREWVTDWRWNCTFKTDPQWLQSLPPDHSQP